MKTLITLIVACALLWGAYEAGKQAGHEAGYSEGFQNGSNHTIAEFMFYMRKLIVELEDAK